jgi:tripartite-type tricarboxylate transporter receptor subunit TctC
MRNSNFNVSSAQLVTGNNAQVKSSHRVWLLQAALAFAVLFATLPAQAQDYPTRDIHAICNFPAGTGADVFVRFFSEKLSVLAGKAVIVDNRGGAMGNIGTEAASHAKPDGYTILIVPGSSTMAAAMAGFKKLPFDPIQDFTPVTTLAKLGFVFVVDPKTPIKSMADLTTHLRAKGAKASYGTSSNTGLVAAELYKKYASLPEVVKVQYRENQTPLNDMYAGNLEFMVVDAPWAIEQAKAGRLRVLAATSADRLSVLPDVPTLEEAGVKGYGDVTPWWAVFLPAKTPQPIVDKLEAWFNQIVASEEAKKFLNNLGSDPFPGNSRMLAQLLSTDIKRWGDYYKLANIEPQ